MSLFVCQPFFKCLQMKSYRLSFILSNEPVPTLFYLLEHLHEHTDVWLNKTCPSVLLNLFHLLLNHHQHVTASVSGLLRFRRGTTGNRFLLETRRGKERWFPEAQRKTDGSHSVSPPQVIRTVTPTQSRLGKKILNIRATWKKLFMQR